MQESKKEILLCLAGKSPQIVTEALYSLLASKAIRIDKIVVITTNECREQLYKVLREPIKELTAKYLDKAIILTKCDILSEKEEIESRRQDSSSLTKLIFETVRELKKEGNHLHCFISGGRKTMSVDLAIALTIYGSESDKLYHVIASEEFARSGEYYPKDASQANELYLIEKPYIKLKHRTDNGALNIQSLVRSVQSDVDSSFVFPMITIHTSDRRIVVEDKEFRFQPLVFAVYLFFAKQRKFIKGGKNFSAEHSKALWQIYEKVSPSYGHSERVARTSLTEGSIDFDLVQKSVSIIRNKFAEVFDNGKHIAEFYSISNEGTYADKRYGIRLPKNRIKIVK